MCAVSHCNIRRPLARFEWRVHRRRAIELDLVNLGPAYVLGLFSTFDEDQHAGIPTAQVAGEFELEYLATMKGHAGAPRAALGTALFWCGQHDRVNQAEKDGVVDKLRWGVECFGGFALVEVVDQPAGKAAAVAKGHLARERAPGR